MPTIQISPGVFNELQELAEPLVDTPDSVIQRLIQRYKGAGNSGGKSPRPPRSNGRRARKGEKTPNPAFYGPLVRVLRDAGGELPADEAVTRVGELMDDKLTEVDRMSLKSGELRWRNTVRFARNDLVKQGKLSKDAPFGIWRLSRLSSGQRP